jgi:hypothetical protein
VNDGLLIEESHGRHDAILEFLSGCVVDVAREGAGEHGEKVGGVEKLEGFDEFATAMTVPNQGIAIAPRDSGAQRAQRSLPAGHKPISLGQTRAQALSDWKGVADAEAGRNGVSIPANTALSSKRLRRIITS